jgi:hypothetical protein
MLFKRIIHVLLLVFAVVIVSKCGETENEKVKEDVTKDLINSHISNYKSLSSEERKAKIMECAGCHNEIYKNELIGPHANAYRSLITHKSEYEQNPPEYMKFIHSSTNTECVKCHSSENLYETVFAGLENESDSSRFNKTYYPSMFKIPKPRTDTLSWASGIDCLTCHSAGNSVVANFSDTGKKMMAECNPKGSLFFYSNTNCYSCHFSINNSMSDNIHNQNITANMSCNSCHIETNESGKKTHYYYWRHDSSEKNKHFLLKKAFVDFNIIRNDKNPNQFTVSWQNQSSPHGLAQCTELLVVCKFIGEDNKLIATHKFRANSKEIIDKDLAPKLGLKEMPGEKGYSFLPNEEAFVKQIEVSKGKSVKEIILEYYEKPQFWVDDKFAMKVEQRKITL